MHGNSVKILIGVFIASVLLFIVTSPFVDDTNRKCCNHHLCDFSSIYNCCNRQVVWKGKTLAVICYDTYW